MASLLVRPGWIIEIAREVEQFTRSSQPTGIEFETLERFFSSLSRPEHELERQFLQSVRDTLTKLAGQRRGSQDGSLVFSTRGSRNGRAHAEHARQLLLDEYVKPWTLASLARAVGCNRTTLQEEFRALTRTTVHQFLVQHRVSIAERLLLESDLKISHVPLEVGYRSRSAFARHFRNVTGLSPKTFRVGRLR